MTDKPPLFRVWDVEENKLATNETYAMFPDGSVFMMFCGSPYRAHGIVAEFSTGFHDRDNIPIFQNDLMSFNHDYWTHANESPDTILAVVTWDKERGAWTLVNTQNSAFRVMLGKHAKKGKIVGRKE